MKKRNVAIIAHVDHGKTTIVNEILKESIKDKHLDLSTISMDNNSIERERGITILAKPTSIEYKGYKINILDTPGHADFGGEVERIMNMVDGVILVVDSYEGTMPQTRFVLKKALERGAKPIVVINKVDKESARIKEVVDEVYELFMDLDANEDQLDFKIIYTSAINGTSSLSDDLTKQEKGFHNLLDTIIEEIPEPKGSIEANLQFQPALLDYSDYTGRIGIGIVKNGVIKLGQTVEVERIDGTKKQFRIQKLYGYEFLNRIEIEEAEAGDVIGISGLPDIYVGETIGEVGKVEKLPLLRVDDATMQMTFGVNTSPMAGKEGKILTARKIKERLDKESQRDVSLKVRDLDSENFIVSGRGELHLGILIENMRREGFEIQVSKPEVIYKEENGKKLEPYEILEIETPNEYAGTIIEKLGNRGANLDFMETNDKNITTLKYTIASRGLIGFVHNFPTYTKGYGIMAHSFKEYNIASTLDLGERTNGVLVSMESGKTTSYALGGLEDRGEMFVEPGVMVYEGQIVGENKGDKDLVVNVTKAKQLTNMRAAGSDATVVLKKPRAISLEYALDYINKDELVEVTPESIRFRKKILNANERKREGKNL